MPRNQMAEFSHGRSFIGSASTGCGFICLVLALLFGLVGLMKFASSKLPTRTVTIIAGDFKQTLHDPIRAALSDIKFPMSHNQLIKIDEHNPNEALLLSEIMLKVVYSSRQENRLISIPDPKLVREGPDDQWHLSREEIEKVSGLLTDGEASSQDSARSRVAFILMAILVIISVGLFLIAKRSRR